MAEVGAFFLERTYRSGALRIYNVFRSSTDGRQIALLWRANYKQLGLEPEWRIKCELCPPPPSNARQMTMAPVFATRERALEWLLKHMGGAHR